MRKLKLYRILKGGKWAWFEGKWHPMLPPHGRNNALVDFLDYPGRGIHNTFCMIEKREDWGKPCQFRVLRAVMDAVEAFLPTLFMSALLTWVFVMLVFKNTGCN